GDVYHLDLTECSLVVVSCTEIMSCCPYLKSLSLHRCSGLLPIQWYSYTLERVDSPHNSLLQISGHNFALAQIKCVTKSKGNYPKEEENELFSRYGENLQSLTLDQSC